MKHLILLRMAGVGFSTGIFFLAITTATVLVFGTPTALKSALDESGMYGSTAKQISQEAADAALSDNDLKLDKSAVEKAAATSFSTEAVQADIERSIDSTYDWLDGTTEKPNITLDLTPYVNRFTQSVGNQAALRVKGLPPCTAEQARTLMLTDIDVSTMPCLPPGINITNVQSAAIDKLVASNEFLRDPVLTTDSLPKDAAGETAIDRAHNIPTAFQWSIRAPRIFAGLALVSAVVIIALTYRTDWKLGVRRLARPLLGTAVTLAVVVVIAKLLFGVFTKGDGLAAKLAGGGFKDSVIIFADSLMQLYTAKLLLFIIIYAIAGAVALIAVRFIKPISPNGSLTSTSTLPGAPPRPPIAGM